MAQRTKRTDENRERILSILRSATTTRKAAFSAVGMSAETFDNWIKADPTFAEAVVQAEQEAINNNVLLVQKAAQPRKVRKTRTEYGPPPKDAEGKPVAGAKPVVVSRTVEEYEEEGDWRAAKWLLETKDPENFGKRLDVTSNGETIKGYGANVDFDDI